MDDKFVTFESCRGHFILVFPEFCQHAKVAEGIILSTPYGLRVVGGGFVRGRECYGRSESINIDGTALDTQLLCEMLDGPDPEDLVEVIHNAPPVSAKTIRNRKKRSRQK